MVIRAGRVEVPVTVTYSARGVATYRSEISHDGLHKFAVIRAADPDILAKKVLAQLQQWNALWERRSSAELRIQRTFEAKEKRRLHFENQKAAAAERTTEAQQILRTLEDALITGIELDPTLDWERLKVRTPFPVHAPQEPDLGQKPGPSQPPPAPDRSAWKYQPRLSFLDRLIKSRRDMKVSEAETRFVEDTNAWRATCAELSAQDDSDLDRYRKERGRLQAEHSVAVAKWKEERARYLLEQAGQHASVDIFRAQYESKSPAAVAEYCERVLSGADYPACIPREFEFDFNEETGVLIVNSRLPPPEDLPRLVEVKYIQTTDTFSEKVLSDLQGARLYDDLLYKVTLRTVNDLFRSDSVGALTTIVFNGIVTSIDKSTGNEATACILSVQAAREPFLAINLTKVDPKACFRQLRGVGSSKLHSITPVAPIMELKRDDPRFVPSYSVAEQLNTGDNL